MSVIFDGEKPEAYHWRMNTEARIEQLEGDGESAKSMLAYLKANSATKDDILEVKVMIAETESRLKVMIVESEGRMRDMLIDSERRMMAATTESNAAINQVRADVKVQIAEAKNSIIVWMVGSVFLAQLLPALLKYLLPLH